MDDRVHHKNFAFDKAICIATVNKTIAEMVAGIYERERKEYPPAWPKLEVRPLHGSWALWQPGRQAWAIVNWRELKIVAWNYTEPPIEDQIGPWMGDKTEEGA